MDTGPGEREAVSGLVLANAPRRSDHHGLVPSDTLDDVDADARPIVVVITGITRPPPEVQPGLGALAAPQHQGITRAGPVQRGQIQRIRSPPGALHALLRGEQTGGSRQPVERVAVDHESIIGPGGP